MLLFLSHLVFWRLFLNRCFLPDFQFWLTMCLHCIWNNRSILKFEISKFQISKFKISNFKIQNFKFQISKFQISKFNSNSQGGNTDTIFILRQTLLTETDRQKWFLYCHFIPLPRRAVVYLVILPWFMICKHIAGFPTKIELFQTRFSFGKKYFMKILNRCMASWLLHLQEYIMKIDYMHIDN